MKYYLIAGEASGDLHGANLIKEIKVLDNEAQFRCWGGDKMAAASESELVMHYKDIAFMGFVEVAKNLRLIFKALNHCKQDLQDFQPDRLVLIDYPGFNLRIADYAKSVGFKVSYYISPQVWAWRSSRVKKIKKVVDQMLVILPFEKAFYADWGMEVDYVGHPLLDAISQEERQEPSLATRPKVALLPGSRKQEIRRMLPLMLQAAEAFPDYDFVIAGAPSQEPSFYHQLMGSHEVELVFNQTYKILQACKAALVTSGTATLEAGLFALPQVVCYKGNMLSYYIGRMLVNVPYISLVNLILDKPAVPELIQADFNLHRLCKELKAILDNPSQQLKDYADLHHRLGAGKASQKAAALIVQA